MNDYTIRKEYTVQINDNTDFEALIPEVHQHLRSMAGDSLIQDQDRQSVPFVLSSNFSVIPDSPSSPKTGLRDRTYVIDVTVHFMPFEEKEAIGLEFTTE